MRHPRGTAAGLDQVVRLMLNAIILAFIALAMLAVFVVTRATGQEPAADSAPTELAAVACKWNVFYPCPTPSPSPRTPDPVDHTPPMPSPLAAVAMHCATPGSCWIFS